MPRGEGGGGARDRDVPLGCQILTSRSRPDSPVVIDDVARAPFSLRGDFYVYGRQFLIFCMYAFDVFFFLSSYHYRLSFSIIQIIPFRIIFI